MRERERVRYSFSLGFFVDCEPHVGTCIICKTHRIVCNVYVCGCIGVVLMFMRIASMSMNVYVPPPLKSNLQKESYTSKEPQNLRKKPYEL